MASSCIGWTPLLLCLVQLLHFHTHAASASGVHPHGHANLTRHHSAPWLCRPDQANTLLTLKQSFSFHPNGRFPYDLESTTTLPSWKPGTDCCLWEGVGCSNSSSGHHVVTALDLSGFRLNSDGIHPVLFNLTSLRMLDLSMNNFRGYDGIPSVGFERLSSLTHLNLSTSGIIGQVPIGISKLTNLVSLDISDRSIDIEDVEDDDYDIDAISVTYHSYGLSVPYFHNIVANLSNLRELYLDYVSIQSSAEGCFKALAKSVPHLRVLSLGCCGLQGDISSLSRLKSLAVINLSGNFHITPGPFPEFLMNFPNLRVLQLSGTNLQGWFPRGTFLSKNLRVLDLSGNPDLSGHLPNFSNAASLETLWIDSTNFTYVKSSYCGFKALTELSIDGKNISTDFLYSFGMLASLRRLFVTQLDSPRQLESLFSWFGGIKNLRSLKFDGYDLSMAIPSSIGNLKNLTSLVIYGSKLTTQTLSSITNIINLKFLKIVCDDSFFAIPSAIGNMTNLERLHILNSWRYRPIGPIPHEVGALKKLKSLVLPSMGLSGRIPSTIANLTQLIELHLNENYLSGEIPASLFILPKLGYLDLSQNQLSGPIHEFDGACSCLRIVHLAINNLTGQIPQSLLVLPNLTELYIEGNNLMGSVDLASLWGEKLTSFSLSYNKLTVMEGEDTNNSSSTYPHQLMEIGLASCNMTKIPKLLMHAKYVTYLDLSSNKISGDIPSWIWGRWNYSLKWISLSDNMFTGMELNSYVIPFSNTLDSFNLSFNRLQGSIPMPYPSALLLDYSNNSFSSLLPNFTLYISSTWYLRLSHNNISGYLPRSICHSPLEVLDLSSNNFSGLLPRCLMENSLSIINLRDNQFKGMLPSNISIGCPIQTINLNGNKIEGQLPRTLSKCTDLEVLDLGRNQIADNFPSWLGGLLNLRVLVLRSNKFHGSIGHLEDEKYRGHFSSLQIIDLASNNFSGKLHPQWFENLKSMKQYDNRGQIIDHTDIPGLYQDSQYHAKGFP